MKETINKETINQSIELISEINLTEEDYKDIFEKFKLILKNPEVKKIFETIPEISEINDDIDMNSLMKKLSNHLSLNELNFLLEKIIKNEDLVDFIQDLFLEKLF